MYMCCLSGMVDIEAETPCGTCTYVDESCIRGHHVSKDFCTPVINVVCSGSQEGKFEGRTCAQKNVSYCSLLLQTGTIMATVRDSHHYSKMTYSKVHLKTVSYTFHIWPFRLLKLVL